MKRKLLALLMALLSILPAVAGIPASAGEGDKISEPGIEKSIIFDDGSEGDADAQPALGIVHFKLESTVPEDLISYIDLPFGESQGSYYHLTFHDTMQAGLCLLSETIRVSVNGIQLEPDSYALDIGEDAESNTLITIGLELVSLYDDGIIDIPDFGIAPITVIYDAYLEEGALAGEYYNSVYVEYEGGVTPVDIVIINTYGLVIFKHSDTDRSHGLEGAVFRIYQIIDGQEVDVVSSCTTDEYGFIHIDGLDAGTYYVQEIQAPPGYTMNPEPVEVILGEGLLGNIVTVYFSNVYSGSPFTGGASSVFAGLALIAAGTVSIPILRRRRNTAAHGK